LVDNLFVVAFEVLTEIAVGTLDMRYETDIDFDRSTTNWAFVRHCSPHLIGFSASATPSQSVEFAVPLVVEFVDHSVHDQSRRDADQYQDYH